jgi:hypothetical protein
MASILTAEDVVRRIAAECAYVDERGGVGIRLEPAAAIVAVRRAIAGAAARASPSAGGAAYPALSGRVSALEVSYGALFLGTGPQPGADGSSGLRARAVDERRRSQ